MPDDTPLSTAAAPPPDPVGHVLAWVAAGAAASARPALAGLDLGQAELSRRLDAGTTTHPWWDGSHGGLALAGADLTGASMEETDLSGANLAGARLTGARGRAARFVAALAEATDFSGADLSGADFAGLVGGEVRFTQAMLEDASFEGARMRFAKLSQALLDGSRFVGADLWGADFKGADADDSVFRGARLDEADLSDVNLTQADFEGASLKKARLTGSRLRGANFTGVKLDGADLSGADLSETTLVRVNLTTCRLTHARFAGAWLDGTRMRVEQLGGAVGEEVAKEFEAAAASYLALEQNWKSLGSHAEAAWAYKRGRRMGKEHASALGRSAYRARDWRGVLRYGWRWSADRFVEWLCDYGESLSRIIRALAVSIALFAVGYGLTGGLIPDGPERVPTYNPVDLMTYSALNMLTANPPDIGIKPTGRVTNLLVGVEGGVGIILMGLFGFVLGNRLRR